MAEKPDLLSRVSSYLQSTESVRRRDLILVFLPSLVSVVLLGHAMVALYGANQQVAALEEETGALNAEIERVEHELRTALIQKQHLRPVDGRDVRALRRHSSREAELLESILDLRSGGVSWAGAGADLEEGFDSPSFVSYVLREFDLTMGYLKLGDDPHTSSRILFENLRYVPEPEIGDLIFYPAGYVFFYFQNRRGQPFVIGMTPYGIQALDPQFAEPMGYRNFWFAGTVQE
jgi:hypothetical protein